MIVTMYITELFISIYNMVGFYFGVVSLNNMDPYIEQPIHLAVGRLGRLGRQDTLCKNNIDRFIYIIL